MARKVNFYKGQRTTLTNRDRNIRNTVGYKATLSDLGSVVISTGLYTCNVSLKTETSGNRKHVLAE
jgi:hypothetical protein